MGLGPLSAIYQARFNRYLTNRGIKDISASHVWAFLGDGEMDEPESTAALALAAREGLDNLTFVINCNLQRLDGPVRANFKIVQELEAQFRGAGWNVVKSLWGSAWDELFAARHHRRPGAPPARGTRRAGADVRDARRRLHPPGLLRPDPTLVRAGRAADRRQDRSSASTSPAAATSRARCTPPTGPPSSTRARRRSSWPRRSRATPSARASSRSNANHQMKKLTVDEFQAMRDLLELPIPDSAARRRRGAVRAPGRRLPRGAATSRSAARRSAAPPRPAGTHAVAPLPAPADKPFAAFDKGSG